MPNNSKIPAAKGRIFHLPLPIQETLERICKEEEPINPNQELFLLIRSLQNKQKIVWEDLVDFSKVWRALKWLKSNNELYKNIILPQEDDCAQLINGVEVNVVEQSEDCNINDQSNSDNLYLLQHHVNSEIRKNAMLTAKSATDSFYNQYSIHPVYDNRLSEKSSTIYQMLHVRDEPLKTWVDKDIDLKCFPKLYPHGKFGQGQSRCIKIRDADFIKRQLMSPQLSTSIHNFAGISNTFSDACMTISITV